jgi:ATP-binding cassette subfamily C protein LapB
MTTLDSLQRMMEATDERQVAARSIVPEIRAGISSSRRQFRYPNAPSTALSGPQPQDRAGRADRHHRPGRFGQVDARPAAVRALRADRRRDAGRSTASTAANITRTSCATASASSARTPKLFSGTVRDNLMLGAAKADDQQLIDAVVRSGADIFLSRDAAGFDLPVGERGSRLSGGQRRCWCWPARWSARRSCCSSTSRPARWTPRPSSISSSI